MSALYNRRPNWPTNPRVARQSTFFNNEGWQLRSGTEFSGLDDATAFSPLIADPDHLTEFITAPDGIFPSGGGNGVIPTQSAIEKLISWVGFVEDDGKEVSLNYTRSLAAGGTVNIDIVFLTDIDIVAPATNPLNNLIVFINRDGDASQLGIVPTVPGVVVTLPTPNIIRWTMELGTVVVFNDIDTYRLSSARLSIQEPIHLTTVAQTGHTAVDLVPAATGNFISSLSTEATENSSSLTIVA